VASIAAGALARRPGIRPVREAPDLVLHLFKALAPNPRWLTDMSSVPTEAGSIFLAVMIDVWSRRVVDWPVGAPSSCWQPGTWRSRCVNPTGSFITATEAASRPR